MRVRGVLWAMIGVALASVRTDAGVAGEVVAGLRPCDGTTLFVKQFRVTEGTTILGAEFRNNDARTVFPEVIIVSGVGDALSEGTVVGRVTDVAESSPGQIRVLWSRPIAVTATSIYHVAVRIPPGSVRRGVGDGPGLGATTVAEANGSFVAGGDDGALTAIRLDLGMSLVTGDPGKAAPAEPTQPRDVPRTFLASGSNPSTAVASIRFGIGRQMSVKLEIYSVAGRRIRTLVAGSVDAGVYTHVWDGRDEHGQGVATGVYIARLGAGEKSITHKIVLAR